MPRRLVSAFVFVLALTSFASAGQVPYAATAPDVRLSHHDRVYTADQFSNTVSVIDPADNKLLGVIRLGRPPMSTTPSLPAPGTLSPLYVDQLLVHGMGFSPDRRTVVVISITSNSATFIDTETNAVKHVTYVGRSPHEAFFTPDGNEVWVTVRGEHYVDVLDGRTYREKARIIVPNGPGMAIFSPDGRYGYVCSSFVPETVVISVARRTIVGRVKQASPFCPNIAATPDGRQVWLTLKDTGKTMVFNARPPFNVLTVLDTGPITNHVNIVRNAHGQFAYVTIGGLDQVKVFRTDNFQLVATIPVGILPHGIWPSGDGTRIYVALEQGRAVAVIDTLTNRQIATVLAGQATQALGVRAGRGPAGEWHAEPGAPRPTGDRGQAIGPGRRWPEARHACHPVRSGLRAGLAGGRHGPRAEAALRAWAVERSQGDRTHGVAGGLHRQPRRGSDRQRCGTDPPIPSQRTQALPCYR